MLHLTLLDWIGLAVFLAGWLGYPTVVDRAPSFRDRSVIAAMNRHRRRWMATSLTRDNRIVDASLVGNLMSSTSFLANTSIFILGGLLAMLGSPDLGQRILGSMPIAEVPDATAWQVRIGLLILIFVNAFFELTWAMRQFNYASILVGAFPHPKQAAAEPEPARAQAEMAAAVANRAARHFNSGLRAYYFGLAALLWIFHPVALILATLWVVNELYRREFRSVVRQALNVPIAEDSET
ncbi:DUF599 domain-containing protein [Roseomonas sp. NAR14]|uniref:DUF599 domain-containing protein n=1 Tax=Roseomonas acroporae TaxID=2937791 RepID=A0A9X2BW92_9PROT|nr:DUF599 family protein [Roseomonas acroporae]MCK8783630.1 DUF599 domain-containing protein [Roseomonas acroporae]